MHSGAPLAQGRSSPYGDLVCQSVFLWQTYTGIARAEAENGTLYGDIFSRRSQFGDSFPGALLQHALDDFHLKAASGLHKLNKLLRYVIIPAFYLTIPTIQKRYCIPRRRCRHGTDGHHACGRAFFMKEQKLCRIRQTVFGDGSPRICIPLVAGTEETLKDALVMLSDEPYDLVEWRVDFTGTSGTQHA